MTKENLALMLDGCNYDISQESIVHAKENDLVIIFGYSDDLCEFRGAVCDEFDCYDGGIINCKELPKPITAVWCPEGKECSWAYETEMPHATYRMYDDDELYCIGIIIDLKEVTKNEEPVEDKHWNECRQIAHYSDENKKLKDLLRAAVEDITRNQCYNDCKICALYDTDRGSALCDGRFKWRHAEEAEKLLREDGEE